MKVCFFGLGSIGKRHLRNLLQIADEKKLDLEIHAFRTSAGEIGEDIQDKIDQVIRDENLLPDDYDIAFITNPTSHHFETIKLMASKSKHMFVEKPVFDNLAYDMDEFRLSEEGISYVARPLVHSGLIRELAKIIDEEEIYSVRAICSSYLPDWRPTVDYREVYSAKKSLGGGVAIDLIHEWDYLTYLFGFPEEVFNLQGKFSHLEIDSEDISIYLARYKDKLVELHLDYFGRRQRREVEIFARTGTITGDFVRKQIRFTDGRETLYLDQKEDMYVNEMTYFLERILKSTNGENNIDRAMEVLKLTKG